MKIAASRLTKIWSAIIAAFDRNLMTGDRNLKTGNRIVKTGDLQSENNLAVVADKPFLRVV